MRGPAQVSASPPWRPSTDLGRFGLVETSPERHKSAGDQCKGGGADACSGPLTRSFRPPNLTTDIMSELKNLKKVFTGSRATFGTSWSVGCQDPTMMISRHPGNVVSFLVAYTWTVPVNRRAFSPPAISRSQVRPGGYGAAAWPREGRELRSYCELPLTVS